MRSDAARTVVEVLRRRETSPESSYVLAFLYQIARELHWEESRQLADGALREVGTGELALRLRVLLAYYYERVKDDYGACRTLIFGADETGTSERGRGILRICRATIYSVERNFAEAHRMLEPLVSLRPPSVHWYLFYSSRVVLANLLLRENDRAGVAEVETFFAGPYFKLIQLQMKVLKRLLRNEKAVARVCASTIVTPNNLPNPNLTGRAENVVTHPPDEWLKEGLIGRGAIVRNLT